MARYWFRQKSFGYGATPNTWQGWTLTLVGAVLIFLVVMEATQIPDRQHQHSGGAVGRVPDRRAADGDFLFQDGRRLALAQWQG